MINLVFLIVAFLGMEFVAWFTHKYVMHGFLWVWHKDHHTPHHNKLERNDLFALIFAIPGILFTFLGAKANFNYLFFLGIGITLYGLSYFMFHDVLVHHRANLIKNRNNKYFRAVIKAHNDHHSGKKNYGFLFMIPWRYFKQEFNSNP
ncbi:MAG: beta-carotene hydroxylase [Bacteroidetes bacterium]|jgi:beta-carotene 3-hydroxylase|nr:beta-carotene hydroxylase [Bacteroidota bacterium]